MNQVSSERALLGGVAIGVGVASVVYRLTHSHTPSSTFNSHTTPSSCPSSAISTPNTIDGAIYPFMSKGERIIKGRSTPPVCLIVIDMQKGFEKETHWGAQAREGGDTEGEENNYVRNNRECEQNILLLLKRWREKKWPIIHVRHCSLEKNSPLNPHSSSATNTTAATPSLIPAHSFTPSLTPTAAIPITTSSHGYEWKAGFEPQKDEIVIEKNVNSAFINTPLFSVLEKLCFPPLVLCGLTTNHCVNTTVRMCGNYGFETFLPFDCTACFSRQNIVCSLDSNIDCSASNNVRKNSIFPAQVVYEVSLSNLHKEFCYVTSMKKVLCWTDTNSWPSFSSLLVQEEEEKKKEITATTAILTPSSSSSRLSSSSFILRPSSPSLRPSPAPSSLLPTTSVSSSSSLSLFEHINLNIPDEEKEKVHKFYVSTLGFCLNPKNTNERQIHVNMGVTQFHLPFKVSIIHKEKVTHAQVWKGRVELLTKTKLNILQKRIEKYIQEEEEENKDEGEESKKKSGEDSEKEKSSSSNSRSGNSSGNKVKVTLVNENCLRVVCPYGNTYLFSHLPQNNDNNDDNEEEEGNNSNNNNSNNNSNNNNNKNHYARLGCLSCFKGHAGGSAEVCGMVSATHFVRPGSAQKIAKFYREILGVPAQVIPLPSLSENNGLLACRVNFFLPTDNNDDNTNAQTDQQLQQTNNEQQTSNNQQPTQYLIFEENELAPRFDLYDKDDTASYHICLYFDTHEAFVLSLKRAAAANLLYVNPRFQGGPLEFSSARSVEEGLSMNQYRVKDMLGGLVLEHEMRSPRHVAWPLKAP